MHEKLNQIQGIRAIAMLGIFITHTSVWLTDDLGWFASIAGPLGGFGVVTFFMLSGYLFAHKDRAIPRLTKWDGLKAAWHRASKMYALYFVTFLIAFVAKFPDNSYDWMKTVVSLPFYMTMTQAFVPSPSIINSFNGPAWFLSAFFGVWLIVYLFPNVVNKLLLLPEKKCVNAMIILLLVQCGWLLLAQYGMLPLLCKQYYLHNCYTWLVYNNPLLCLSEFCCGIIVGRFCRLRTFTVKVQNWMAFLAVVMTICYMVMLTLRQDIVPWIVVIECLVSVGLISCMSSDSFGNKVLSLRALVRFGNLTGYFFLIHGAINFALRATVETFVPKPWLFFISFAISLMLSVLTDWLYRVKKYEGEEVLPE